MVLRELIFNCFYFGKVVVVLKEQSFQQFLLWEVCGDLKRTAS